MQYENVNIEAQPVFWNARCPKHSIPLFQIDDGFLKSAWFCPKCGAPYTVGLIKMKKWNKKALNQALMDKKNKGL